MARKSVAEYLFHQGTNFSSYEFLGCNVESNEDKISFSFRTWAPNAKKVELVSDINGWDNPKEMVKINQGGIWETFFDFHNDYFGKKYKFKITSDNGTHFKGDPYCFASVGGDDGASVIYNRKGYSWNDYEWLERRKSSVIRDEKDFLSIPINIYELHIGSFLRSDDGGYITYRQLADILPDYLKRLSFTHVEFLPVQEHPYDGSWGYQVCGFFAVSSRYGTPDDFKYLVDSLHSAGIGVIVDFVAAHFPKDEWGLFEFDGSPLYEYQGEDRKESRTWGTRFFDLGREEIQSFLISSALYFIKEMHIDGLRVDAVASMLYLDYDKLSGEWIPNDEGTNENKEAIAFFKKLNSAVHGEHPDVLMIAEESGSYGKITKSASNKALCFDLKWNMGFSNDLFDYIKTDPLYRKYKHSALNFPITYAFSERFILPVSHDEVVHGKKNFADKPAGTINEKLSVARATLLFFMTFPGKKLFFMGYEYGQIREWDFASELEWFMLDYPLHYSFREFVCALNYFYLQRRELWECDFSPSGFEWISCDEADKNIISFVRISKTNEKLYVIINFSGIEQTAYIRSGDNELLKIIFQSEGYADNNALIESRDGFFSITLQPNSGMVLENATFLNL